ncbi:hypothetical protein ABK040_009707 [Willaertia magna]
MQEEKITKVLSQNDNNCETIIRKQSNKKKNTRRKNTNKKEDENEIIRTETNGIKKSTRGRKPKPKKTNCKGGSWTDEEHEQFLKGYELYGNNWSKIADLFVITRQRTQVASHAQKWLRNKGKKI